MMLEGKNPLIRENAVDVLASFGPEAASCEAQLMTALASDGLLFRAKVIEAIGQVAKPTPTVRERLNALGEADTRPAICIALQWAHKYLDAQIKASV